jgi:5-formyltetrahydrofolate cyclo-ligase
MKRDIRQQLRAQRNQMAPEAVTSKSRQITDVLIHSELFQKCASVFTYLDVQNEVQTRPLIDWCFQIGKPVFVPAVRKEGLFFSQITDFVHLKEGVFGILDPTDSVFVEPDSRSLFVIPGLGFDENGGRIGYGAGYYDKYLFCRSSLCLLGICFEEQIVSTLPAEKTDIFMDAVLTEKRWIFPKKASNKETLR